MHFDHNSKRWRKKAKVIMHRDKHCCQYAATYGRCIPATCVHHIFPVDEYPQYAWCSWNLIALSNEAHNMMHDRKTGRLTALGKSLQRKVEPQRQKYDRAMRRRRTYTPPGSSS